MLQRNFTPFPELTTERLKLRQLVMSDNRDIFELRSDPRVNKYLERKPAENMEEAIDFITAINARVNGNEQLYWVITLGPENEFVGTICLFNFSDDNESCEIGFELSPKFQKRGIMREAATAVINFGKDSIGLRSIDAFVHVENQDSHQLLTRLNFSKISTQSDKNEVHYRTGELQFAPTINWTYFRSLRYKYTNPPAPIATRPSAIYCA
jgi:[ribosomal protein S5]-alanine N-acetyltransferase